MDTRKKSEPSRWELAWVQPAHAFTVYILAVLFAATLVLGTLAYVNLLQRTRAVCEPLRFGERAGQAATSKVGKDFARTFGGAANKLGCSR